MMTDDDNFVIVISNIIFKSYRISNILRFLHVYNNYNWQILNIICILIEHSNKNCDHGAQFQS